MRAADTGLDAVVTRRAGTGRVERTVVLCDGAGELAALVRTDVVTTAVGLELVHAAASIKHSTATTPTAARLGHHARGCRPDITAS